MTLWKISDRDMRHCHFLNSTCDIGDPPSRAPRVTRRPTTPWRDSRHTCGPWPPCTLPPVSPASRRHPYHSSRPHTIACITTPTQGSLWSAWASAVTGVGVPRGHDLHTILKAVPPVGHLGNHLGQPGPPCSWGWVV